MRVAVVTPYFEEPRSRLERCIESVRSQTHDSEHILIADGRPQDWLDAAGVRHLRLDRTHRDYGNTPRGVGALLAASESFDAVCFLDADNWYQPEHVARCMHVLGSSGADYVVTGRNLCRDDGSIMAIDAPDDADGSHVDTNCFFLPFATFHTLARWVIMPKPMAKWGDRFYLTSLRAEGLKEARTGSRTVNYLCTWAAYYQALGEEPPPYAKSGFSSQAFGAWASRLTAKDRDIVRRMTGVALA